jgi:hypothetical protein
VYVPKAPNENGWLRCEQLELWLGTQRGCQYGADEDWLRWIDNAGRVVGLAGAIWKARAEQEKARADQEKARADALARELAELRERVGR